MAYRKSDGKEEQRIISPTEAERLLAPPDNWTRPDGKDLDSQKIHSQMRNAVGNAVAVPVVRRILQALCLAVAAGTVAGHSSPWLGPSSVTAMWHDNALAAPWHPDVLDDLMPKCETLAVQFSDLLAEFDSALP